ncbi:MAG: hypothetical protein GEV12_13920 [Micromonosporaceae bacterium]|nr:hypothetical protein [Micromonosporaceae bacterium]
MTTAGAATTRSALVGQVGAGVIGGLVGGIIFGVIMATGSDMLIVMIGQLLSSDSTSQALGWVVHLAISIFAGGLFAVLVTKLARTWLVATLLGVVYGVIWWLVGAMWIMPTWLGMSQMIFDWNDNSQLSLWGHLAFGLVLGLVYGMLAPRLAARRS